MTLTDTEKGPELQQAFLAWAQELAPHGIVVTDEELIIRGWNNWFEINSGLSAGQVIGRPILEVFPGLKKRGLSRYFSRALEGEVSILSSALHGYLFELPAPLRDLGFQQMQQTARIAPLICGDSVCGTVTTVDDVTQRDAQSTQLRLQHERAHLLSWALAELLKTNVPEQLLHNLLPRVARHIQADVFLNFLLRPGTPRLSLHTAAGISPQERDRLKEFNPAEKGDSAEQIEAWLREEIPVRTSVCHALVADNRRAGLLWFASRTRDSLAPGTHEFLTAIADYVAIAVERTRTAAELKATQAALTQHAEELEARVRERTAELSHTVADLESFTYTVAHDLRAPLRHMRGYANAVMEECAGELGETGRHYVERIRRATAKMDDLTHDLLQYSTVAQAQTELVPVHPQNTVDSVVTQLPQLAEPGVLTVERPLQTVLANPMLLQQCLLNLLQNALKFTKAGSSPRIRLFTTRCTNMVSAPGDGRAPFVRISIEDNGIGVDKEFRERIFGVFERACRSSDYEGTGIGLAIVAKAMQRMGGRFGVESEPGLGSTFWIELPSAEDAAHARA